MHGSDVCDPYSAAQIEWFHKCLAERLPIISAIHVAVRLKAVVVTVTVACWVPFNDFKLEWGEREGLQLRLIEDGPLVFLCSPGALQSKALNGSADCCLLVFLDHQKQWEPD